MGWIFWIWNHEGVGVWQIGGGCIRIGEDGYKGWEEEGFVLEVQRGDHGWGVGSACVGGRGGAGEITSVMM